MKVKNFYFSSILFLLALNNVHSLSAPTADEAISLDRFGVPLSVPVIYQVSVVRVDESADQKTLTEVSENWERDARLDFLTGDRKPGTEFPTTYFARLVVNKENQLDFGHLPHSQLASLFKKCPFYRGSPVAIELAPHLWASAQFDSLVVSQNTYGRLQLFARFQYLDLRQEANEQSPVSSGKINFTMDQHKLEIPFEKLEDQVWPRPKMFSAVPKLATHQKYVLAVENEPPIPVFVLGFVPQLPLNGEGAPWNAAYVIERIPFESATSATSLKIYQVPSELLRLVFNSGEYASLMNGTKEQSYKTPLWLSPLVLNLNLNLHRRVSVSLDRAAYRLKKVVDHHLTQQHQPQLLTELPAPCGAMLVAAE